MKTVFRLFAICSFLLILVLGVFSQIPSDPMRWVKYYANSAIGYAENYEPIDTIYSLITVDFTSPTIPGKSWKKVEACCGAPNGDVITVTVFYDAQNSGISPTVKRPYVIRCVAGERCTAGTYRVNCPPDDSCDIIDRYLDEFYKSYDTTGRRVVKKIKSPTPELVNGSDMD